MTQDSHPRAKPLLWRSRPQSPWLPCTITTHSCLSGNIVGSPFVHRLSSLAWVSVGGGIHIPECVGAGIMSRAAYRPRGCVPPPFL